jgi:hypothetical protein
MDLTTVNQLLADIRDEVTQDLATVNALIETLRVEVNRPSGVVVVHAGDNLQAVLDALGDTTEIRLEAGATFTGTFHTRVHAHPLVTIRADSDLPERRIGPGDAALLPKLAGVAGATLTADAGAGHYAFVGLEFVPNLAHPEQDLVCIGDPNTTSVSTLPDTILFDRCYFHGDEVKGQHRGLMFNVTHGTLTRCYFEKFIYSTSHESQAVNVVLGHDSTFDDCYFEASGENVMFGGSDPKVGNELPHDFTITHCDFFKPLEWKTTHVGTVKNLFEIKNGCNIVIDGCTFTNSWADGQSGDGVCFTVRNQGKTAPWSTVAHITFINNIITGVENFGINGLGLDDRVGYVSVRGSGLTIRNNWITAKKGIAINNGFVDTHLEHNTVDVTYEFGLFAGSMDVTGLVVIDNVLRSGSYGVGGGALNTAVGKPMIEAYCATGYVWDHNVIERTAARTIAWPAGNYLLTPGTLTALLTDGVYAGTQASTDGTPLGYTP